MSDLVFHFTTVACWSSYCSTWSEKDLLHWHSQGFCCVGEQLYISSEIYFYNSIKIRFFHQNQNKTDRLNFSNHFSNSRERIYSISALKHQTTFNHFKSLQGLKSGSQTQCNHWCHFSHWLQSFHSE